MASPRTKPAKKITNAQIAALALAHLDGGEHAIDTEDLAMKMAALAPDRFRWKKYPEQINLGLVRSSVARLRRSDPPLASGGVRDGWMLTPAGIAWCQRALGLRGADPSPSAERAALLRQTAAFTKFQGGVSDDLTVYDARQFFKIDEYTSHRRRRERYQAVCNTASGDDALTALVTYLRERFSEEWA